MSTNSEQLLEDVLLQDDMVPAQGFRERLLEHTLVQVRRRKIRRNCVRATAVFASLAAALMLWNAKRPVSEPLALTKDPEYTVATVQSLPLRASMWVQSDPRFAEIVLSHSAGLTVISSESHSFREIGDNELLTLLAGRPGGLVRVPGRQAELVFANPTDAAGFLLP